MIHSIIVGYGLAGFAYALELSKRAEDFVVIDNGTQRSTASFVAAGLCNPINLKRYTLTWNGVSFFSYSKNFYQGLENMLSTCLYRELKLVRLFSSVSEQNLWQETSKKDFFSLFMQLETVPKVHGVQVSHLGAGVLQNIFMVNVKNTLLAFRKLFLSGRFIEETFDYSKLKLYQNKVSYKGIESKNIVFCQGYGLTSNPFLNYLPLVGNKGEALVVKSENFPNRHVVKSRIIVVPLDEKGHFWVGPTYDFKSKMNDITVSARLFLTDEFRRLTSDSFRVMHQMSGIRPTVKDRRPLLGRLKNNKRVYVFNGLGTRGVMMAPLLAKQLLEFIEAEKDLDENVSIDRFSMLLTQ